MNLMWRGTAASAVLPRLGRRDHLARRLTVASLAICTALGYSNAAAAPPEVIPQPVRVHEREGTFTLTGATAVEVSAGHEALVKRAAEALRPATGFVLPLREGRGQADQHADTVIAFKVDADLLAALGEEGYRLRADAKGIEISAATEAGAFYGLQTLRQMFPPEIFSAAPVSRIAWTVPAVDIEDRPCFRWRGLMLDCARHFMPKDEIKRFIDLMALHKLNTFHWHLTDDQGWRLEIKKYPKLTEVGSVRKQTLVGHAGSKQYDGNPYGGFYTQDDVREIVTYAAERHITIVPEIEMPGHSRAAIAAYPELGCTGVPITVGETWGVEKDILNPSAETVRFYEDVLSEVIDLFPGPYVHIGGDEAPKDQWKASQDIAEQMRALGLKDPNALQAHFTREIAKFLESKHRRLIGWDDILDGGVENLPGDAVVMNWQGPKAALKAAAGGHDVVMAPNGYTYLDHYQSKDHTREPLAIGGFLPLERVYQFDPILPGLPPEQAPRILGGQVQLWSEYLPTSDQFEYMAFPRACAFAETVWSPASARDFTNFMARLKVHLPRLAAMNIHFRPLDEPHEGPGQTP
jgi:hexosaminidase